jgi:hypothetical protein
MPLHSFSIKELSSSGLELHALPCRDGICAASPLILCGTRGQPVCVADDSLCGTLLMPAFPQMTCVDSSEAADCGTLASSPCSDSTCIAPMVVNPDDMCVPAEDAACGSALQSHCYWGDAQACLDGLTEQDGLCMRQ